MLFSRSIVWIGKKVITYCSKTPFIPISANLVVFCRSVTRLKTRAGLAGAGFVRKIASKSHRNRMKNRMCKRAFRNPVGKKTWRGGRTFGNQTHYSDGFLFANISVCYRNFANHETKEWFVLTASGSLGWHINNKKWRNASTVEPHYFELG